MRQTLFFIPGELYGVPVFGFGWALLAWVLFSAALLTWLVRKQGWNDETRGQLPVLGMIALAIIFVLPRLEEAEGLPIRGYGVFLLIAVVSGVGLAIYRARLMGVDPEVIYSLAFVLFLAGIAGARAVFVYEYWPQFASPDVGRTLMKIFNVAKGGLVVYGSVLAGVPAMLLYVHYRKLPFLALADLIAPSLMLGLAIGRIGCLMNGCCYGGVCDYPWAIEFPPEAPPYSHQRMTGELHGFRIGKEAETGAVVVRDVFPDTPPAAAGLKAGDKIVQINDQPLDSLADAKRLEADFKTDAAKRDDIYTLKLVVQDERGERADAFEVAQVLLPRAMPHIAVTTGDGRRLEWTMTNESGTPGAPAYSRPIHPTQIYATINASLLCLLLLAYYPYRRHDGEVIALLMTTYAIARILEEVIRDDEGNFLLGMTISQTISAGMLLGSVVVWLYVCSLPPGSALPPHDDEAAETPSEAPEPAAA